MSETKTTPAKRKRKSFARNMKLRAKLGKVVGAGYFVFRRDETNRVQVNPKGRPFEHPSLEAAMAEAKRLAHANKMVPFSVFQQVTTVMDDGSEEDLTR